MLLAFVSVWEGDGLPALRVPGERAEDPSPVPFDTAARTFGVLELAVDCAGEGLAAPNKLLPLGFDVLASDPSFA